MTTQDEKTWAVLRAGEGKVLDVFGVQVTLLAGAGETAGACSIARLCCPPGTGAPLHRHAETERFHVLSGALTVQAEGETILLGPGDTAVVEPWAVHSFSNGSSEEVEFIAIGTPAGHEDFFHEADELARSGRFNPETAAELCTSHGIELVR